MATGEAWGRGQASRTESLSLTPTWLQVWMGLGPVGLWTSGAEPWLLAALIRTPVCHREQTASLRSPPETALETPGPELDVEATDEEAATLVEPGPQPCLHISIAGSGLEMAPGPIEGDTRPELVPFDSDSDDESSPSPSGTLQSQASRSTISSSFGSECPAWGCQAGWTVPRRGQHSRY